MMSLEIYKEIQVFEDIFQIYKDGYLSGESNNKESKKRKKQKIKQEKDGLIIIYYELRSNINSILST